MNAAAADAPPTLAIVTVVYRDELPMLSLQARSLARFAGALAPSEIIVCVNDVAEAEVTTLVEGMRADWGVMAPTLRVIGGETLLTPGPGSGWRSFWTRWPARKKGGWRGHDGWQVQQAMKLAVARHTTADLLLMLDAKNVLIAPLGREDIVAADGRPRARFSDETGWEMYRRWYPASARLIGAETAVPARLLSVETPFCIDRATLCAVVDALEGAGWPVAAPFCRPRNRATEFMLIAAWCVREKGSVEAVFAPGLFRSFTVFSGHDPALALAILQEALDEGGRCIGLHRRQLDWLGPEHLALLSRLLTRHGLLPTDTDPHSLFDPAPIAERTTT